MDHERDTEELLCCAGSQMLVYVSRLHFKAKFSYRCSVLVERGEALRRVIREHASSHILWIVAENLEEEIRQHYATERDREGLLLHITFPLTYGQ